VSAAMNRPAASPIRWLLAEECAENQCRMKCACWYTERSQERLHELPRHDAGVLSPIVSTVPLQLLAYHAALLRGNDVDKPRNLATSLTVE